MDVLAVNLSYPQSTVGYIELNTELFDTHGQPCSSCQQNRYLSCINGSCQCPLRTYFDGSVCQSQNVLGNRCVNSRECRQDINYTCLPREQCGPESIQYGIVVAGDENRTAGNALGALSAPYKIDFDQEHRMYVADSGNHRIMRYDVRSRVGAIVAGLGGSGTTRARFSLPISVGVDRLSNIYVSDHFHSRVMLWLRNATSGRIVAGNGMSVQD